MDRTGARRILGKGSFRCKKAFCIIKGHSVFAQTGRDSRIPLESKGKGQAKAFLHIP